MLYRLLRPDEKWKDGLRAKNSLSDTTVYEHVTSGSWGGQSKYISTSGSLHAVLTFRLKSTSNSSIVKIWEKNLPIDKIDLRTQENRKKYLIYGNYDGNNIFNSFANKFKEVLLVGNVPETHVELLTESDFHSGIFLQRFTLKYCLKMHVLIIKYSKTFSFGHLYYAITLNKRTLCQDLIDTEYGQRNLIQTATCTMWSFLDDSMINCLMQV
jgi:hypothetical protein